MEDIEIKIKKFAKKVEKKAKEALVYNVDGFFHEAICYQIKTGGKRFRPKIAFVCSKMLGGKEKDIIYPASGLEILHNYTLIIDDIIDDSRLRRGEPTTWARYGKSIAECITMDYAATIFEIATCSSRPVEISRFFSKILKFITEGEIMDILFEQAGKEEENFIKENRYKNIKEEDYLEMTRKKTAYFIENSCKIGGICANAKKKEITALGKYGFNLGMTFQISDDLLDIFGKEERFGKKIGKDIEERKGGNCVIYFAFQEFSLEEKEKFWKILRKKKIKEKDVARAIKMIKKTKARERAIESGERFAKKAKESLSLLPQNKWNNILFNLVEKIMERSK